MGLPTCCALVIEYVSDQSISNQKDILPTFFCEKGYRAKIICWFR